MPDDKLLVRGVNWVGDAVMSMPAISSLRRAYPDAHITLLVKPWVAPLFEASPDIDEIMLYEERHGGIAGRLRLASELRRMGYSRAVLLQNAFDAALITALARIPVRIGYNRDFRRALLTNPIPFNGEDRKVHHIEYYLGMLRLAGIKAEFSVPWIELKPEERLRARQKLSALRRPVIGINPGAKFGPAKQWAPERFGELVSRIVGTLGGSAVIFGTESEAALAGDIVNAAALPSSNAAHIMGLAGATTLRQLCALISECDALVTTDSGPMHIGYATRTPTVAIFGSTDPALTGPSGYGNVTVRHPLDCSPCFKRDCKDHDLKCMDAITTDEVFQGLTDVLPSGGRKAVFFDRDGTLCQDAHYLNKMEDFKVFPQINSLKALKDNGFKLIGITNQSGIARGLVEEDFVQEVNGSFVRQHGFDGFYYCPHLPQEGCACRKPSPEMLYRARAEHGVDLRESYVIGDKEADMGLARAVGACGILVLTGESEGSGAADYVAKDLGDAVGWILGRR